MYHLRSDAFGVRGTTTLRNPVDVNMMKLHAKDVEKMDTETKHLMKLAEL